MSELAADLWFAAFFVASFQSVWYFGLAIRWEIKNARTRSK